MTRNSLPDTMPRMPETDEHRSTRGNGLLEAFLARRRHAKARLLLSAMRSCESVLDLGCGQYPLLLSSLPIPRRIGIDRAPGNTKAEGITVHTQDLCTHTRLPFEDASFDAVTMLATLEHLQPEQIADLMRDVHRVLKPGGRFIFTTPHLIGSPVLWVMTILGMVSKEEIEEHHTLFTKSRLLSLMTESGFHRSKVHVHSFQCGLNIYGFAEK